MCWYCTHGWPKPISDIYVKAARMLDGNDWPLHFGASHIVWSDCNFDLAQACLDKFDVCDYTPEENATIRWSLEELLKVPLEFTKGEGVCKLPCPNDCSLCPPPAHWIMVSKGERRKEIYGNKS